MKPKDNFTPPDGPKKSSKPSRVELCLFIVLSIFCAIGLAMLFREHPGEFWFMPRCPFYALTGWYCPGCGSLRSTHFLLHGDLAASFRYHPLLIPLLFCVFFLYVKRSVEFYLGINIVFKYELPFCLFVVLLWLLFFVIRNIPCDSLDRLRPPEPPSVSVHTPNFPGLEYCGDSELSPTPDLPALALGAGTDRGKFGPPRCF